MAVILLVDDDAPLRRSLCRMLERAGHTVVEAEDGVDGVRCFRRVAPDLVVTDIVMPDQEGLETIRKLHALAPHVPIVAMSGAPTASYLAFARDFGALHVLAKPFPAEAFLRLVGEILPRPAV